MITVIKLTHVIGAWTGELTLWDRGRNIYYPTGETDTLDEAISLIRETMKTIKVSE